MEAEAEAAAQARALADKEAIAQAALRKKAEAQAQAATQQRSLADKEASAQAALREKADAQAQAAAQQPQGIAPSPVPGVTGGPLKIGSRGPAAKKLQIELKRLGLYAGPINATFDKATSAAVRKYEVMKGVMPTGLGSPDLRAAVTQDVRLVGQYAS